MSDRELDIRIGMNTSAPDIKIGVRQDSKDIKIGVTDSPSFPIRDYDKLINKPQINGITLAGNKANAELQIVMSDSRANWDSQVGYIPKNGQIVVYTDYYGDDHPAIKIGDGLAYLIDLPVVGAGLAIQIMQALEEHASNTDIHVSGTEKTFWNNKLNVEASGEELILNRE